MPDEMTDEELEDWGLAFIENEWDEQDDETLDKMGLTEQQKNWLAAFFYEIDLYRD